MKPDFWIKAWNEGRTAFHQPDFHEMLTEHFPELKPKRGQRVLVPLCGKTKDLLWLQGQELIVHGVELHEQAVKDFFSENHLSPVSSSLDADYQHYGSENIIVSCGDFFKLRGNGIYDFVYDRAALVALPPAMRKDYARVVQRSLKKGGKCLLITYEYDQSTMEGPPFSVATAEVLELYQDQCSIQLIDDQIPGQEGPRLAAIRSLRQKVYILEKIR
jgi:thiopurine S-methyltransferase